VAERGAVQGDRCLGPDLPGRLVALRELEQPNLTLDAPVQSARVGASADFLGLSRLGAALQAIRVRREEDTEEDAASVLPCAGLQEPSGARLRYGLREAQGCCQSKIKKYREARKAKKLKAAA
jgi:hypothetical protein